MSSVGGVILSSTQHLLGGLLLTAAAAVLALAVYATLFTTRTAWRGIFVVFAATTGTRPGRFDVLAGGDHVGVDPVRRRRRLAVDGSVFAVVRHIAVAVAVSCRQYYRD